MRAYQYARLSPIAPLTFYCTNPEEIDRIVSDLKPIFVSNRINRPKIEPIGWADAKLLFDQRAGIRISHLDNFDEGISWWILSNLLQHGWQIVAYDSLEYHLSRELTSQ
jgi:hypothetical protein